MRILIDTSAWIDYFKSGTNSGALDDLLENNQVVINDIILAELIPFLRIKKQRKIIELLNEITKLVLQINWTEIIQWQTNCLTAGFNGIGIPDLLIAQNSKQHNCKTYSLDRHFIYLNQCDENIQLFA